MHKYEEIWLILSVAVIIIAMGITGYQAFALGMGPPSHKETIDPAQVDSTAPFDKPGVYEVGENQYEVVMTLETFQFVPNEITVPQGAEVTFIMTSKDVVPGGNVPHPNRHTMVL